MSVVAGTELFFILFDEKQGNSMYFAWPTYSEPFHVYS